MMKSFKGCRERLYKAVVLAVVMVILLVSCKNGKESKGKNGEETLKTVSSDAQTGNNSTLEQDSTVSSENKSINYSLDGEYSVKISLSRPADDANEYRVSGNCSILNTNLKGYADKQADDLRNEILNTKNTTDIYRIKGRCYYVSPNGNNDFDGKTPKTALRTVDGLDGINLEAGDAVLFERNSIFRITRSISAQSGITYGSYGKGDKPKIYACAENYANRNLWQPSNKKNVWKTNFAYGEAGNTVFNHGESVGYLKDGLDKLNKNTQFYHNQIDGIFYLYCDGGNPGDVYKDIEICPNYAIFSIPLKINNVTVDNLCLKYSSGFGVSGLYLNEDITVTNCEIGYIGGEYGSSGVRYGNAIQIWCGGKNMVANHNWIYQTFDTAISPQGQGGEADKAYTNISYCNNLLEYNSVDFEWFDRAGAAFDGIKCDGNIMRFTSLGWGNRMDDAGIRGIEGCIRANTCDQTFNNFSFKNNIIDCPGRQIINWTLDLPQLNEIKTGNNNVFVNATYRKVFPSNPAILSGLHETGTENSNINATNQSELEAIWKFFDKSPTSVVKWYS